jgi:hypothetical protein
MVADESSDCHIIPTGDTNIFRLRARLPSPEDDPARCLGTITVVAGCRCTHEHPSRVSSCVSHSLVLEAADKVSCVSHSLVLEAADKVSTRMVLVDKTGSPAPSIGTWKSVDASRSGFVLTARRNAVKAIGTENSVADILF